MTQDTISNADAIISALSASHERLAQAAAPLRADDVTRPAYPSEWSIADTMSHLGSGAEIFGLLLSAGSHGHAGPERDDFVAIWDDWNAKAPLDQVHDAVTTDLTFIQRLTAMSAAERSAFTVTMFNGEQDLAGFLTLRLGEHAVHTWDVRVALDPSETLAADTAGLMLANLPLLVSRTGRPSAEPLSVGVDTQGPDADFVLRLGPDGATLDEGGDDGSTAARLTLPAEAFVRLVYGRLDADHTPAVTAEGVELDQLRQTFPGF